MTRASAFVLGYHGCDRAVGERVLAGKEHLKASDNDYDWLGSGIYFWENSPGRVLDWANLVKANPKLAVNRIVDPFVVGAIIDLGNCLDLLEAESIDDGGAKPSGIHRAQSRRRRAPSAEQKPRKRRVASLSRLRGYQLFTSGAPGRGSAGIRHSARGICRRASALRECGLPSEDSCPSLRPRVRANYWIFPAAP
jgi:hypothetical protein